MMPDQSDLPDSLKQAKPLDREAVIEMLATFGDRTPQQVPESIGSMELAWLVHQVEQRYATTIELDDEQLARMGTIAAAVEVMGGHLGRPDADA
jgi:hypothetical protein